MKNFLKSIGFAILLLLSFVIGFGIWWGIFYFFTGVANVLLWSWRVKVLYLFFGSCAVTGVADIVFHPFNKIE